VRDGGPAECGAVEAMDVVGSLEPPTSSDCPGISVEATRVLPRRHPACRQHDHERGASMERVKARGVSRLREPKLKSKSYDIPNGSVGEGKGANRSHGAGPAVGDTGRRQIPSECHKAEPDVSSRAARRIQSRCREWCPRWTRRW
jgi:hypothetical protein